LSDFRADDSSSTRRGGRVYAFIREVSLKHAAQQVCPGGLQQQPGLPRHRTTAPTSVSSARRSAIVGRVRLPRQPAG